MRQDCLRGNCPARRDVLPHVPFFSGARHKFGTCGSTSLRGGKIALNHLFDEIRTVEQLEVLEFFAGPGKTCWKPQFILDGDDNAAFALPSSFVTINPVSPTD